MKWWHWMVAVIVGAIVGTGLHYFFAYVKAFGHH
jgi:hypothetical protein